MSAEKPKSPKEILIEEFNNYISDCSEEEQVMLRDEFKYKPFIISAITKYHQQFKLSEKELTEGINQDYHSDSLYL